MFHGKRLIDHVHARLAPQVDEIILSGKHDYGLDVTIMPDLATGPKGPAAALFAALAQARIKAAGGFLTVPVDGPNLPPDVYAKLCQAQTSAIAHAGGRLHPTFAYWRTRDLAGFFDKSDKAAAPSLHFIADSVTAKQVAFDDDQAFFNINSPEDIDENRASSPGCRDHVN